MTMGLSGCCAVFFKDESNNLSLSHVDELTDLNFLRTQATQMKGLYTIDIIAQVDHLNSMAKRVSSYLKKNLPDIKNSKGTTDIRKTKTGVVLIRPLENDVKLHTPLTSFSHEIFH